MKLVEILARELKEWPEGAESVDQSVVDRELYAYSSDGEFVQTSIFLSESSDNPYEEVTRAQWQEAREALSKPANFAEPNWNEAPGGFDYFIQWPHKGMRGNFYRIDGDRYVRDNDYYASVKEVHDDSDIIVTKRPIVVSDKTWSGEGLPPAGTVCELRNVAACTDWAQATVVFASRNVVVWDWAGEPAINGLCTAYAHAVEMRPIRTPEQIAAEEREQAISEMIQFCSELPCRQSCADLYDAGYRKVKDGNQEA